MLKGLRELIQKFQSGGEAETVDLWIAQGQNAPIQPGQLRSVLGQQTIGDLMRHSGLTEQELLTQLAKVLPNLVDNIHIDVRKESNLYEAVLRLHAVDDSSSAR